MLSRNIKFDKAKKSNWDKEEVESFNEIKSSKSMPREEDANQGGDSDVDSEFAVRGNRPLAEIYQRCNLAITDPISYEEAIECEEWRKAIKEKIHMIEKNKTWELVEKPEATKPDLMFSATLLSRFMSSPSQSLFATAKQVLRYVKGTAKLGVWYLNEVKLKGYVDSDWAGNRDDMKSSSGYLFSFGSGPFSWNSKKQEVVAQSTVKAEYISTASAANQALCQKTSC
ncbi:hypothetical protein GH714_008015 [Hevea brasiliensis]|uniref:Reverse transcriptase Ty1/copia-type domain-containing protein n=1 Tax=Hevea brasiliensis TaxID=3981 RepID=A0A6A6MZC9_HEVBR|nr:hypothetical protein GH714_008015 [Hevea brasiliensis]